MIKTVKVKKQLRLDELIKYVIDKGLNSFQFTSDNNVDVYFSSNGYFLIAGEGAGDGGSRSFDLSDTFTIEVEEEIAKNTPFEWLVAVNSYGSLERYEATTITDVLSDDGADCFATKIYALIGNKLELIWEAK